MKLLWLCNIAPGAVQEHASGKRSSGLWMDHVLKDLRKKANLNLRVLCPGSGSSDGRLDDSCSYGFFTEGLPYVYLTELEEQFRREIQSFCPDVIHIWGTEYGHTLAMVNAAEKEGVPDRVVVSIQGLCSIYADHYAEGVPYEVQRSATFRDLLRRDNIRQQQEKFALRGKLEVEALRKVHHIIGRTDWDLACTTAVAPDAAYHFCNETLREEFYEDGWVYESCRKHRIFASSCAYPIKGFHYLLTAFRQVKQWYPDATLAVPGNSPVAKGLSQKLRQSGYQKYLSWLISGLEDSVEFLGHLSAEEMKHQYLDSNVFVLPSTIENSPNSLGEAMLLGVPCVAADVGGVKDMLTHNEDGYVYQSAAPYMLAHYIHNVFEMENHVQTMADCARSHAAVTHDPQINLQTLMNIYREVARL